MVVMDTPEPEHGEVASCSNRSQKGSLVEKDEGQGPKAEKMSQRKARNNESPGSTDLSTSKMVEPISIASNPQVFSTSLSVGLQDIANFFQRMGKSFGWSLNYFEE